MRLFYFMETKEISPETLKRIKTLDRISWETYLELIELGEIKRTIKLKHPKTIFYDEIGDCFVYLNPVYKKLNRCAVFTKNI